MSYTMEKASYCQLYVSALVLLDSLLGNFALREPDTQCG